MTLSEQIYQELYRDITRNHLAPGQKLTLKVLKERFGSSHTPIREALNRLAENGLVTYVSNSNYCVTSFTEEDIRETYQFMAELDAMAIRFCRNAYNPIPLLLELEDNLTKGNQCLEQGDTKGWLFYSHDFHIIFYRHAQNGYLEKAAEKIRARISILSSLYSHDDTLTKINDNHEQIYQRIKDGDYDGAAAEMVRHLQYDMVFALNAYKKMDN